MTHRLTGDGLSLACGGRREGARVVASAPTCPDCRSIERNHPYLLLSKEERREMANLAAALLQ